ncbi:MAG: hypothetical protein A2342_02720 [Gallionellales bacterium RIFOXYB12_FULL_54_9]|nr:MAG: hypothetical protein A2342_02720 [Gallionellales bacterium RIFOXYB12_FULL_54_9]
MLDNSLQTKLLTQLVSRYQDDNPARFYAGRGADKKQINTICGDVIDWLDEADSIIRIIWH